MDKWLTSVATGKPFEAEARFRRADGKYRWCLCRGVPLRDETGNIIQWHGTTTDIEDRKRVEEDSAGVIKRFVTNFRERTSCCVKNSVRVRCLKK